MTKKLGYKRSKLNLYLILKKRVKKLLIIISTFIWYILVRIKVFFGYAITIKYFLTEISF